MTTFFSQSHKSETSFASVPLANEFYDDEMPSILAFPPFYATSRLEQAQSEISGLNQITDPRPDEAIEGMPPTESDITFTCGGEDLGHCDMPLPLLNSM